MLEWAFFALIFTVGGWQNRDRVVRLSDACFLSLKKFSTRQKRQPNNNSSSNGMEDEEDNTTRDVDAVTTANVARTKENSRQNDNDDTSIVVVKEGLAMIREAALARYQSEFHRLSYGNAAPLSPQQIVLLQQLHRLRLKKRRRLRSTHRQRKSRGRRNRLLATTRSLGSRTLRSSNQSRQGTIMRPRTTLRSNLNHQKKLSMKVVVPKKTFVHFGSSHHEVCQQPSWLGWKVCAHHRKPQWK